MAGLLRAATAVLAIVCLGGAGLGGCASAQVAAPPPQTAPQTAPPPPPPSPPMMRAAPPPQSDTWAGGIVPMCFEDPQPDDDWAREQVLAAAGTWEGAARVHFNIAADCASPQPGNAFGRAVPIRIVHHPEMFASTTHLGNSLLMGGEVTLNAEYLITNRLCGPRGTVGEFRCFYADALHELGHALGFAHDHVSPRAPDCLARTLTPEATNVYESYYDPDSIMNYCNDHRWEGQLSAADKCSVASAYGPLVGDRPTRAECYAMVGAVPTRQPGY